MKKATSVILALLMAIGCLSFSGCGGPKGMRFVTVKELREKDDLPVDVSTLHCIDLESSVRSGDKVCIIVSGGEGELIIPEEDGGAPVTCVVGSKDIEGDLITSITFPDSVKYIENVGNKTGRLKAVEGSGDRAKIYNSFNDCNGLEAFDLTNLNVIEDSFNGSGLQKLTLDSKKHKEGMAQTVTDSFNNCENLETAELSSINETLSKSFCKCPVLKSAKLPNVSTVSESFNECDALEQAEAVSAESLVSSFSDCPKLSDISITAAVTIEDSFNNCGALETVNEKSKSLETVTDSFKNCASLSSVGFLSPVKDVKGSFNDCPKLNDIPELTELYSVDNSFRRCDSLDSAEFVNSANLMRASFSECPLIESVELGSVGYIESSFLKCEKLKTVSLTYSEPNDHFDGWIDGTYKDGLPIISSFCDLDSLETVKLSGTIGTISASFNDLPKLTKVDYKSLAEFKDAFQLCPKLKTEIIDDEERAERKRKEEEEKKRKEEEERKRKEREKYNNEPYGPGTSGIVLNAGSYADTFTMLRMNSTEEFKVTVDANDSVTKYFPCGRYVLKVSSKKRTMYSEIFNFQDGSMYEITTGTGEGSFYDYNPLENN